MPSFSLSFLSGHTALTPYYSRALPLLPLCAFMAGHKENFTFVYFFYMKSECLLVVNAKLLRCDLPNYMALHPRL